MINRVHFATKLEIDNQTGKILVVYFQVRTGRASETKELANGRAFANYDKKGRLLGIELLAPCEVTVLDQIVRSESRQVREFIRETVPRRMAIA